MRELAEGAVPSGRELRIIEIEYVAPHAVRKRGVLCRDFGVGPEHGRFAFAPELDQVSIDPAACLFGGAAEHCREAVNQMLFGHFSDGARNVARLETRDPRSESFGDVGLPLSHTNGHSPRRIRKCSRIEDRE
jgi:hypothetical protein